MSSLTAFLSDRTAASLLAALRGSERFQFVARAETLADCCPDAPEARPDALLLELTAAPPSKLQDLMRALEQKRFRPAILLFARDADGQVRYALSAEDALPLSAVLEEGIHAAFGAGHCRRLYYRLVPGRGGTEVSYISDPRNAALVELTYGASRTEISDYIARYRFNLLENGYYAYFWELNSTLFANHFCYKDLYIFIGYALLEGCRRAIAKYSGGEVFYVKLTQLCVLINEFHFSSGAQNQRRLRALLTELGAITGSYRAIHYVSKRFPSIRDLREVFETYMAERQFSFFLGQDQMIDSASVEAARLEADPEEINRALDTITKCLRYDVHNLELDRALHGLFLDLLKYACDLPMYYYTASVLASRLMQTDSRLDAAALSEHLDASYLSHSSIEDEYAFFCRAVEDVRRQSGEGKQSKNALMNKAMEFIRSNYRENILVSDIANALYVSETYLSRISRALTGKTMIQNLVDYRISQAKIALEEQDTTVYAIAEQCGFRDVRHFSKTFKKATGQSPTEYRHSHFWGVRRK
jgi:AraC-like DNA-binding protein